MNRKKSRNKTEDEVEGKRKRSEAGGRRGGKVWSIRNTKKKEGRDAKD